MGYVYKIHRWISTICAVLFSAALHNRADSFVQTGNIQLESGWFRSGNVHGEGTGPVF